MIYLHAILLSFVQAITEFLPISSSGHLILLHNLLKDSVLNNISYDVALHFGSILAILIYFWQDIKNIIFDFFSSPKKSNLLFFIFIGIIPAGFIGYFFSDFIDSLRSVYIVVASLIFGAILFLLVEKYTKIKKDLKDINLFDSIFIGLMQVLSFVPGISRSGITISSGMIKGFSRVDAARFSFIMAVPLILGASIKEVEYIQSDINIFIFGLITSFVFSLFAVFIFINIIKKYRLNVFAYYRLILAFFILIYLYLT